MCCHQHPDNGHGLALEKVDSSSMPPWTLEELRELAQEWDDPSSLPDGAAVMPSGIWRFLDWLGEQG